MKIIYVSRNKEIQNLAKDKEWINLNNTNNLKLCHPTFTVTDLSYHANPNQTIYTCQHNSVNWSIISWIDVTFVLFRVMLTDADYLVAVRAITSISDQILWATRFKIIHDGIYVSALNLPSDLESRYFYIIQFGNLSLSVNMVWKLDQCRFVPGSTLMTFDLLTHLC